MISLRNKVIWQELAPFFLFGFLAFSLLVSAVLFLRPLMILLVEYHVQWRDVIHLYFLGFPQVLVYTLPLSALLSTLLGINRLSGRGELDALYTSGVRFSRILIPPLCLGIISALATGITNEWISPAAQQSFSRLQNQLKNPEQWERKNLLYRETLKDGIERVILAVSGKAGILVNITWLEYQGKTLRRIITAESAHPESPESSDWILFRGQVVLVSGEERIIWTVFDRMKLSSGLQVRQAVTLAKSPAEMNFSELTSYVNYLKESGANPKQRLFWDTQRWTKLYLPFSALIFAILGACVGALSERSSSSYGLGLSILLAFVFYIATMVVLRIGQSSLLSPPLAASLPYMLTISATSAVFLFHPRLKGRL